MERMAYLLVGVGESAEGHPWPVAVYTNMAGAMHHACRANAWLERTAQEMTLAGVYDGERRNPHDPEHTYDEADIYEVRVLPLDPEAP